MSGPTLALSESIHAEKYRMDGETFRDAVLRFTGAMADDSDHFNALRPIHERQEFMPAGRVQAAMGSTKVVTPYNCFVSPTIHDSFVDGPRGNDDPTSVSIMRAAEFAAQTMRQGGGIGYDFSTLRPSGDVIRGVQSVTDGPMAFMPIFDAVCKATASAGNRRGAQMGVMRVDHPDIEKFIKAKSNSDKLNGFNISVAVTDEFMRAKAENRPFMLQFEGRDYHEIDPNWLWDEIMRGNWDWAEPGVLFIDTINKMNNLWYCETIAATNPCGEQPLPPYGACLLGSINLPKLIVPNTIRGTYEMDLDRLEEIIPHIVRGMDNVVDRAKYPLPQQEREAKSKRRMGLGVTGLANALEAMGMPYGSSTFVEYTDFIMGLINKECYMASVDLAKEKGEFELMERDLYLKSGFMQVMDDELRWNIQKHGIRNSHLTSVAPTGTISLTADNVSSGCEPVFSHGYDRKVNMKGGQITERVDDYGVRHFDVHGRTANEVSIDEHLDVLLAVARNVDSAVSKTCNFSSKNVTFDQFKKVYDRAWEGGAKGCTTYHLEGKRSGILVADTKADKVEESEAAACTWNPETGVRSCE